MIDSDSRRIGPRELGHAVRCFLEAGGRVMIDPDGKLRHQLQLSYPFDDWLRPARARAGREAAMLFRKLDTCEQGTRALKRIVTILGHPTTNGWRLLEAKRRPLS